MSFDYLNKKHVNLILSGECLKEDDDYSFDNKGTIRIKTGKSEACSVIIRRVTPPQENAAFAVEEIRDEMQIRDCTLKSTLNDFFREIESRLLSDETARSEEIDAARGALSRKIDALKRDTEEYLTGSLRGIYGRMNDAEERLSGVISSVPLLLENIAALKSETALTAGALSREIRGLITDCVIRIADLENKIAETEKRLNDIDYSPAPLEAFAIVQDDEVRASLTEKHLTEIRSALNMETQIRRREDAQIKTLLKRLLEKYARLEDFVAGETSDLSSLIIADLRRELRERDDKLGRVHLENIVRIEGMKTAEGV